MRKIRISSLCMPKKTKKINLSFILFQYIEYWTITCDGILTLHMTVSIFDNLSFVLCSPLVLIFVFLTGEGVKFLVHFVNPRMLNFKFSFPM